MPAQSKILEYFGWTAKHPYPVTNLMDFYQQLAIEIDNSQPPSAEKQVALRKLLESQDAALRELL